MSNSGNFDPIYRITDIHGNVMTMTCIKHLTFAEVANFPFAAGIGPDGQGIDSPVISVTVSDHPASPGHVIVGDIAEENREALAETIHLLFETEAPNGVLFWETIAKELDSDDEREVAAAVAAYCYEKNVDVYDNEHIDGITVGAPLDNETERADAAVLSFHPLRFSPMGRSGSLRPDGSGIGSDVERVTIPEGSFDTCLSETLSFFEDHPAVTVIRYPGAELFSSYVLLINKDLSTDDLAKQFFDANSDTAQLFDKLNWSISRGFGDAPTSNRFDFTDC